ncbi:hypothetical protein QRD89_15510 [Halobacillus sp. ACCC02827]|uniref:hypothetical protein n=1 Tax=Halobacillus sp. ACCC02827 TaxID=3052090 RepID=UPI00256FB7E6|nr:hypothetical protein [Halobacillus sp. ACCC02827]WJE15113.1 hypothetical protein QRD89_15510 [Halobacillus sp. ACCC02827]
MNVQEWMPLIIWFIYLVIFAAVVTGIIVFIKLLKSKSSSAHPVEEAGTKRGTD